MMAREDAYFTGKSTQGEQLMAKKKLSNYMSQIDKML